MLRAQRRAGRARHRAGRARPPSTSLSVIRLPRGRRRGSLAWAQGEPTRARRSPRKHSLEVGGHPRRDGEYAGSMPGHVCGTMGVVESAAQGETRKARRWERVTAAAAAVVWRRAGRFAQQDAAWARRLEGGQATSGTVISWRELRLRPKLLTVYCKSLRAPPNCDSSASLARRRAA